MSATTLRIATRKSPLALWQANYVKAALEGVHSDLNVELLAMTTRGDKIQESSLAKVGGKGLFVKELEHALLENRADIAVHSMKDVPMDFPQGLGLAIICEREDPADAFVSNNFATLAELPEGATIGTSSFRRQCQKELCGVLRFAGEQRGSGGRRREGKACAAQGRVHPPLHRHGVPADRHSQPLALPV